MIILSIFNKIYYSKGGFSFFFNEKDPLEFTFILYKFIFEDLKLIEVIKFPRDKSNKEIMKELIDKFGKQNANTSKTTSGIVLIAPEHLIITTQNLQTIFLELVINIYS